MPNRYLLMTDHEVTETRSIAARMFRERFGTDSLSDDDVKKDVENTILRYGNILKLAHENNGKSFETSEIMERGLVNPGLIAPVVRLAPSGEIAAEFMRFGFPLTQRFDNTYKSPFPDFMYNARSETVTEKNMFADHVLARRCIVPIMGYLEGPMGYPDREFLHVDYKSGLMYFAGIYKPVRDKNTGSQISVYCLLTQDPEQPEVKKVHQRMPLLIERDNIKKWLACGTSPANIQSFIAAQKAPLLAVINRTALKN